MRVVLYVLRVHKSAIFITLRITLALRIRLLELSYITINIIINLTTMKKELLQLFILLLAALAFPVAVNAQSSADVNGDGEVTVADINSVISVILGGTESTEADVNGDGEVTVADINSVIDSILGGSSVTPPPGPGGIEGFSDETIALLRENGMNIYDGNEPPVIEGVYAMEPVVKIAEHGWGDWEDATIMLKMIFNFGEQFGSTMLFSGGSYQMDLETEEVYAEGDNYYTVVRINGQGNKFTVSYTVESEDFDEESDTPWGGAIISGEKTNDGIKNLQMASVIFGMPMLGLTDVIFDIYADSDGMSYPCEWPEWPEDDWIKSPGQDRVKPLMMSKAMKMLKSLSESTNRNE